MTDLEATLASDIATQITSLRARLEGNRDGLVQKYSDRIDHVENYRRSVSLLTVLGALMAGGGRFIGNTGLGLWVSAVGLGIVFLAGISAVVLDRRKLDIGQEAKTAQQDLQKALELADQSEQKFEALRTGAKAFDEKRAKRLKALEELISTFEAALLLGGSDVAAAQEMLKCSIGNIRGAIDFSGNDMFTLTIYRCQDDADGTPRAHRIAREWTHPALSDDGRTWWEPGDGFTGAAWRSAIGNPAGECIIADSQIDSVRRQYPVRQPKSPEHEQRYCSVAAVPILTEGKNRVWGIVTATNSRKDVFRPDEVTGEVQNVAMIRDIAVVCALLAGLKRAANLPFPPATAPDSPSGA